MSPLSKIGFLLISWLALLGNNSLTAAQTSPQCPDGQCRSIFLAPLEEEVTLDAHSEQLEASDEDRFDRVIKATIRVTVAGVCGSGTIVGRDSQGNALVLTNAHVAGTARGRVVNVERWNLDGTSERGEGAIIAAGYGQGLSVDFALLKCNTGFAKDVSPVPLANRYPDPNALVTTYGCPRCEWPSLQVLNLTRRENQILTWKPQAIGGRSGSSVIDYTDVGPRVVGLLTWGGNGEGLGQSTPFLLEAMKGRLPAALEPLPAGVTEVTAADQSRLFIATYPIQETAPEDGPGSSVDQGTLDKIIEPSRPEVPRPKPKPEAPEDPPVGLLPRLGRWLRDRMLVLVLIAIAAVVGVVAGVWYAKNGLAL